MLCTGYYALMNATLFNSSINVTSVSGTTVTYRNSYNTSYDFKMMDNNYSTESVNSSGYCIFVGSGDTPVKVTDKNLDSIFLSDTLTYGPLSYIRQFNNGKLDCVISRTFINKTNAPITIKEVGLFNSNTSNYYLVLLSREILSEPITLQAGESISFQAKIF